MERNKNEWKREIKDSSGNSYRIAMELIIDNRNFIITLDKIIFEKVGEDKYERCSDKDEKVKQLQDFLNRKTKSEDLINEEFSR